MKTRKKSITHQEHLKNTLAKNPREAVEYLNQALREEDTAAFLMALQDVAKAYGGMTGLARKTGLNREGLYDALSGSGNPAFGSLSSILNALGFRIVVEAKRKKLSRKTISARHGSGLAVSG